MRNDAAYPVRATGYAFDNNNMLLGLLDLRYFGKSMPRTLSFDVSQHKFPASTQLMIAFQIGGGGSPCIPRPPLITSVSISAQVGKYG